MATTKTKREFRCSSCGHTQPSFFGFCPSCSEAGTASEQERLAKGAPRAARRLDAGGPAAAFTDLSGVASDSHTRRSCGIAEVDRVLGGGIVPGSYMVLSAAPGQGKSTLASQLLDRMSAAGMRVGLVAAEESIGQVKLRFERLGASGSGVDITTNTIIEQVMEGALAAQYDFLVVDSIQTVFSAESGGAPGTISQVRECGQALMRLAKEKGITVLLIGQVTKDGTLAGPRTLEHMVDVVMEFEGEREQPLRILRAVKNRFGSTDEIGVFEMTAQGLVAVDDPSQALGVRRSSPTVGAVICPVIEGSRPLLVEVQALVSPTNMQQPIRACRGIDPKRFQMLTAVLSRRAKMRLGTYDIHLQLSGGIRVEDPALDLACCMAIASAYSDSPVPANAVAFGEVSLLAEVRPAIQSERRRGECSRMGYDRIYGPPKYDQLTDALDAAIGPVRQLRPDADDDEA